MTKLDLNLMQKQSITELLAAFGYSEQNKELNFEQYFKFLQSIAPITEEEAKYIFRRTDLDSSGSISIKEITNIL